MTRLRFIDLSVPIQESVAGELRGDLAAMLAPQITYEDHDDLTGHEPGDRVGIDEVRAASERTGAPLAEGEIVLLTTTTTARSVLAHTGPATRG